MTYCKSFFQVLKLLHGVIPSPLPMEYGIANVTKKKGNSMQNSYYTVVSTSTTGNLDSLFARVFKM